ncbi:hypothetical protein WMY93_022473 [Mugilogobius chulae]|uniref:Uncharacterized protein n=1 Tax=Mugilogobius chulae TaxID=88201 RepID=A0AAW0NJF2_9GOBI
MAQRVMDPAALMCVLCFGDVKGPVTLPCGHSYCNSCIQMYWDVEREKGYYSCPVCRTRFPQRPSLKKNYMLANIAEAQRNNGIAEHDKDARLRFLQHAKVITMDPNTAGAYLGLSEDCREVKDMPELQKYRSHPDRFLIKQQVRSRENLMGRCYWEVEWDSEVLIAVAYEDTDKDLVFGDTYKSWALKCHSGGYGFVFNKKQIKISVPVESRRIGVYLDHKQRHLAFYSVHNEGVRPIYRVHGEFTQPLYAGVWLYLGATARFPDLRGLRQDARPSDRAEGMEPLAAEMDTDLAVAGNLNVLTSGGKQRGKSRDSTAANEKLQHPQADYKPRTSTMDLT